MLWAAVLLIGGVLAGGGAASNFAWSQTGMAPRIAPGRSGDPRTAQWSALRNNRPWAQPSRSPSPSRSPRGPPTSPGW